MNKSLDIQIQPTGASAVRIAVIGRVDGETFMEFDKLVKPIIDKNLSKIVIDMSKCSYVSSAGISSFFDFRKQVQSRRGAVSFFNLQPQIKKVFEIVKALPLECVFSSAVEADAYLDRMMAEELKKTPPTK